MTPRPAQLDRVPWRKSTRSGSSGSGQCVEAASLPTLVAIRDSKHATGDDYPVLTVTPAEWTAFLTAL